MDLDDKITQKQAADLLNISMARMSELCRDGWVKRDTNGKVTPRITYLGYIASIKEGRNTADIDLKVLKGKLSAQQFNQREGKYQQKANEEAYAVCMEAWPMVANFLTSLPAICSRDNTERKRIKDVIDNFQRKFVEFINTNLRPAK